MESQPQNPNSGIILKTFTHENKNNSRLYFMINLHESMGLDQTHDHWLGNGLCHRLHYSHVILMTINNKGTNQPDIRTVLSGQGHCYSYISLYKST